MELRFFGFFKGDICNFTFQTTEKNQLPNLFINNSKTIGRKWFEAFTKRNGHGSLRT